MSAGDVPAQARVFASLGQGWTNMWPAFWILLLFGIIEMLVSFPSQIGQLLPEDMWALALVFGGIGTLLAFFVGGPLGVGVAKAHLATSRAEKPEFSDLGYGFSRYWQAVLLAVLSFVFVIAGLILLVIPGLIVAVRLTFAAQRFVHDELDAMDAIKASWEDTRGRWWRTFGLILMSIPLAFAGFLALGVGVFVAMVWIDQSFTVYWRSIEQS